MRPGTPFPRRCCFFLVTWLGYWGLALPMTARGLEVPGVTIREDVVYGHKDGLAMTYDVFSPRDGGNGRGLVFMVSGGWVSIWAPPEQAVMLFRPFLDAGYTVIPVRHGSSPKYLIPEIVSDVRTAFHHISENAAEYSVDAAKLGVFGFSAGGHLSLVLGTTTNDRGKEKSPSLFPRVAAVAAVFPPTDLAPYVDPQNPLREQFPALKFDPAKADEFSPLRHVTADDAPTLLVHGDRDELVPLWHSEKIRDAFATENVPHKLVVIEGAGHGFNAEGMRRMFENMVSWFNEHLR